MKDLNSRTFIAFVSFLTIFISLSFNSLIAQSGEEKPKKHPESPADALHIFSYYTMQEHFNVDKASSVFVKEPNKNKNNLTLKLKQILDGKGLKIKPKKFSYDKDFVDTVSKDNVFIPFPEYPEIYLEKNKADKYWYFSKETEIEIPKLHRKVFPFGTGELLNLLPKVGTKYFLGLTFWQYYAIFILICLGIIIYFITSRVFSFIIKIIANSRFGENHFDKETVKKLGRILSYLLISYMVFLLVPVLQLPIDFVYFILLGLRLTNTTLVMLLALRTVSLLRSYFQYITQKTQDPTDEHLVPVFVRIINAVIIVAAVFNAMSIFHVNITALIAGLSIGGLAIALAAQETVKNLFGSMMIYADRPFKIGDMVTVGAVTGTIVDVGFRSTRIRTLDTTLISVPNGNLMNETINNLGERQQRRYHTIINIAYHTPLELAEAFVDGMRFIAENHPETDKENININIANLGANSIEIVFQVFFNTIDWGTELKWREEVIKSILQLAQTLGVKLAYPTSTIQIESMPNSQSNIPDYKEDLKEAEKRLKKFEEEIKIKFKKSNEDLELESTEPNN